MSDCKGSTVLALFVLRQPRQAAQTHRRGLRGSVRHTTKSPSSTVQVRAKPARCTRVIQPAAFPTQACSTARAASSRRRWWRSSQARPSRKEVFNSLQHFASKDPHSGCCNDAIGDCAVARDRQIGLSISWHSTALNFKTFGNSSALVSVKHPEAHVIVITCPGFCKPRWKSWTALCTNPPNKAGGACGVVCLSRCRRIVPATRIAQADASAKCIACRPDAVTAAM